MAGAPSSKEVLGAAILFQALRSSRKTGVGDGAHRAVRVESRLRASSKSAASSAKAKPAAARTFGNAQFVRSGLSFPFISIPANQNAN